MMIMKRCLLFLLTITLFSTSSFEVYAQPIAQKFIGTWKGGYKDEFPDGTPYRVTVEFRIEDNFKFEAYRTADYSPLAISRLNSNEVVIEYDATSENLVKYYFESINEDWGVEDKFRGKPIGHSSEKYCFTLELSGNSIIWKCIGREVSYYNKKGKYIGKEWIDDTIACVLHKQD